MSYTTKTCRWCGATYVAGVRSLACPKEECQIRNRKDIVDRCYKAPCKGGCGRLVMRESLFYTVNGKHHPYKGYCRECMPPHSRTPKPEIEHTCMRCGNTFMAKAHIIGRCPDCRMFYKGEGITLQMIGDRYGFTRERARQFVYKLERTGLTRREAMEAVYANDPRKKVSV